VLPLPQDPATVPRTAPARLEESAWRFAEFRIPASLDLLYRGAEVAALEPLAVRVLRHLVRHSGRVVGKRELLDEVWPGTYVTEGVLKKAVSQIRRALDDPPGRSRFVETFHRRGYCFVAPAEVQPAVTPEPVPTPGEKRDLDFDQLAGRGMEMEALRAEYRRAMARKGTPILVLGDAGVGKTQLARHFEAWAAGQGARCLYTRFFDYGGSRLAPHEIFLDLLRTALAPAPGEDLRSTVAARFGIELPRELFESSRAPSRVEPLAVSSGEAALLSDQTADAIGSCFVALSREAPLVLQLDDLQWADPPSLAVVACLLRTLREEQMMLVALARPPRPRSRETLALWLREQAGHRGFSQMPLPGLSEDGFRQALAAIFGAGGGPEIAEEDLLRLHRLTEGNPYFLTEVLRGLAAEGVIHYADGGWRCGRLGDLRLPDTLTNAARALLDDLEPAVREVLEPAAVIGDEFRLPTLSLVTERPAAEVEAAISRALQSGVVSVVQLSPGEDCRFRHTLLRQVLYDDLPPWRRRALHGRTAQALEQIYAAEPNRVAEALAAHWRLAGDLQRAFSWGLRAAQAALGRWQWRDALGHAERARQDAGDLGRRTGEPLPPGELIALRVALGQSLSALGRAQEAEAALEAAAEDAGLLGDERTVATVFFHLAQARVAQGRQAEAREASESALARFTAIGEGGEAGASLALSQLVGIRIAMGEYLDAAAILDTERRRLRIQPAHTARLGALLGWALALQGSFTEAIRHLEIAVAERRTAADPRGLAALLGRLQWAYLGRGDYPHALELAREANAAFHEAGDRLGEVRTRTSRGQILVAQGLPAQGLEILRQSAESLREMGDVHCEAEALWLVAVALTDLGRLDEARALLDSSLARVREVPDRDDEFRMSVDLARVHREQGRPQLALEAARLAHGIAVELGCHDGAGHALAEISGALRELDAPGESLAAAREAVGLLSRSGSGGLWRALWALALAQAPEDPPQAVVSLELCEARLAAVRETLPSAADHHAFEEVRRRPLADLHRLLLRTGEDRRARDLQARWPVALG